MRVDEPGTDQGVWTTHVRSLGNLAFDNLSDSVAFDSQVSRNDSHRIALLGGTAMGFSDIRTAIVSNKLTGDDHPSSVSRGLGHVKIGQSLRQLRNEFFSENLAVVADVDGKRFVADDDFFDTPSDGIA